MIRITSLECRDVKRQKTLPPVSAAMSVTVSAVHIVSILPGGVTPSIMVAIVVPVAVVAPAAVAVVPILPGTMPIPTCITPTVIVATVVKGTVGIRVEVIVVSKVSVHRLAKSSKSTTGARIA